METELQKINQEIVFELNKLISKSEIKSYIELETRKQLKPIYKEMEKLHKKIINLK